MFVAYTISQIHDIKQFLVRKNDGKTSIQSNILNGSLQESKEKYQIKQSSIKSIPIPILSSHCFLKAIEPLPRK